MVLDDTATQTKITRLRTLEDALSAKRRSIRDAIECLNMTIPDTIKRTGSADIIKNKYNEQTGADFTDAEREAIHAIWDAKATTLLA